MKLLDSLYKVVSERNSEAGHEFEIYLDREHFIYRAHFPGEPVTPGVCIMQIAVELLALAYGAPLEVKTVKNIKFLKIISPEETPDIIFSFPTICEEDSLVKAKIVVSRNGEAYAKLSLVCSRKA